MWCRLCKPPPFCFTFYYYYYSHHAPLPLSKVLGSFRCCRKSPLCHRGRRSQSGKNGGLYELGWLELLKLKMQEDSPGGRRRHMRNERYNTPTKPKKLSVSGAKQKAKEFATKDDKSTRVLAKQAILKELSTHLVVRAQSVAPQSRRKGVKSGNDSGMCCKIQNKCCCLMFATGLCLAGNLKSLHKVQASESSEQTCKPIPVSLNSTLVRLNSIWLT